MTDYVRRDSKVELFARGGDAVFRLTLPGGSERETAVPRDVVDRAARGDDDALNEWLIPAGVTAALASTTVNDDQIARVTISVGERSWAGIAWERFAPADACIVRASEVRPRVRQIPLSLPMRILEVGVPLVVASALDSTFFESDRSAAVEEGATILQDVPLFPQRNDWPTVEILHVHGLTFAETDRSSLLAWLQPFVERFQTRLIVIERPPAWMLQARELAQTIVERGGPAVWLLDHGFTQWPLFYAQVIHDRPLDWMRGTLNPGAGELFAGSGREELLRYSATAAAFDSEAVIKAIAASIPAKLRIIELEGAPRSTASVIQESLQRLHIPPSSDGSYVELYHLDRPRSLRLGAAVSTRLIDMGVHAPDVDKIIDALRRTGPRIDLGDLATRIDWTATRVSALDGAKAAAAVSAKLRDIVAVGPELRFEDHESEGMLPLAAKVADARIFLRRVRGEAVPKPPPKSKPKPKPPRHVNTAFFAEDSRGDMERLPQKSTRLRPGALVHFGIQIGEKDRLVVSLGSTAFVEEVVRSPTGTSIEIGLTAIDFDLAGDPVQHLWLPPDGPTDLVTFAVRPRKTTTIAGIARLRVSLFHENNVVQSFLVAAVLEGASGDLTRGLASALHAEAADVESVGKVGYLTRLEYCVSAIAAAASAGPRALTIVANESAGEVITTIKGAELFRVSRDPNISDSVTRARAALDRASAGAPDVYRYMFNQDPNAGDPATLLDALWNVAREGWDIFSRLVRDENGQAAVRAQLASGMGIHAAHIDAGAVVPWSLVYDRKVFHRKTLPDPDDLQAVVPVERALCRASMPAADGTMPAFECGTVPACLLHPAENARRRAAGEPLVCADTVICPRRFWGFMHSIEVPVQQVSGVKTQESATTSLKKEIHAATPIAVVAGFNPNLGFAGRHADRLKEIFKARAALLTPPHSGRDSVLDQLEKAEPDIVYFFCHAIAALKDKTGRSVGPALDFGKGYEGDADDVLEDADFVGRNWAHAPLVFLNGCSTAGFSPYASSKFITMFIRGRKAAAVIGTEVTVWEVLATGFATAFLEAFLDRKPAGEALLLARRALLAKENPLGLVYTLYGSSELKIAGV